MIGINNIKKTKQAGFTIIEILAALFIFTIIVAVVGGIFVNAMNLERRTFSAQKIQENSLRSFEMMAREIRVSQVLAGSGCIQSLTMNSPFTEPAWGQVVYGVNGSGQITRSVGNGSDEPTTSSDTIFEDFEFCVDGTGSEDNKPSIVTMSAKVSDALNPNYPVNIQTTITSRYLGDEL